MLPRIAVIAGGLISVIILLGVLLSNQEDLKQKRTIRDWFRSQDPKTLSDWFVEILPDSHAVIRGENVIEELPLTLSAKDDQGNEHVATISGDPKVVCRDKDTCSADLKPKLPPTLFSLGPIRLAPPSPTPSPPLGTPYPQTTTRPAESSSPSPSPSPSFMPVEIQGISIIIRNKEGKIIQILPGPLPEPEKYKPDETWIDWFWDWYIYDAPSWL